MTPSDLVALAGESLSELELPLWAVLPGEPWKIVWTAPVFDQYGLPRNGPAPSHGNYFRFVHPDDAHATAKDWERALSGRPHQWQSRIIRIGGEVRHIITTARLLPSNAAGESWLVGVDNDVTDMSFSRELIESERSFRFVAENVRDVVFRFNQGGDVEFVSPSVRMLLGYEPDELIGRKGLSLLHPEDVDGAKASLEFEFQNRKSQNETRIEHRMIRKDGSAVWVEGAPKFVFDADKSLLGRVDVVRDIELRRETEARFVHMATHDALTGLPNRGEFEARLVKALASKEGDTAMLCIDLDRFKPVNDALGHPAGDELLREVARRLLALSFECDSTVGRLGGDEFVMFLTPASSADGVSLAKKVISSLSQTFIVAGNHIVVGASVGISIGPANGAVPAELLRTADVALYRAKAAGQSRWRLFEVEMDADQKARHSLELALRQAIVTGAFEVHFQPIFGLMSRKVTTMEALIRWRREDNSLVSPDDFIPLAEDVGLIVPIGEWVLREGCRHAVAWPDDIILAVNLSPGQFRQNGLESAIMNALLSSGLPPYRLELEITENLLLEPTEAVLAMLHRLKKLGIRIALDDFGTGYSSLSFLRSFPFDKIKIDQSFVKGLDQHGGEAIVTAVAGLGAALGIVTTAEGIETPEQLRRVLEAGCVEGQGFYLCPPRHAGHFSKSLSRPPIMDAA